MADPRCMTVAEFARQYRVGRGKVLQMIRAGELPAVNTAAATSRRPRYVIRPEDIEGFVGRRSAIATAPAAPRRRRLGAPVKEWF